MSLWIALLIGWGVLALLMSTLWVIQRRTHNAGIVDIAWSFGVGLMGVWLAFIAEGDMPRRIIVGVLAAAWSLRLGFYLLKRVTSESEDGRYRMLRDKWGDKTQLLMFAFFQIQAAWAVMFALPMWAAASNPEQGIQWYDLAGAMVLVIAVAGESVADAQLNRFRNRPGSEGKVCKEGLWRYSRHPNYFFEWLGWWAYVLIAIASPYWYVALAGPVVMYLFISYVTGIPPTEKRALHSRGDAYREYQRTTNALFPGPPETSSEESS